MYDESSKATIRGLSETCPALSDFSHAIRDQLTIVIGNLDLLEKAESPSYAEAYRARALEAANNANEMFREVGL